MMLLDLININKVRRFALYCLIIMASLFLQCEVFSRIAPLGVKPMLLPVLVVAFGVFEGGVWGAMLGIITGVFGDIFYHENVASFTVLFAAAGFTSGVLAHFAVNKRFVAYVFLSLAALIVTALAQMFRPLVFLGADAERLIITGALQTLWGLPFTVIAYPPVKSIAGRDFIPNN